MDDRIAALNVRARDAWSLVPSRGPRGQLSPFAPRCLAYHTRAGGEQEHPLVDFTNPEARKLWQDGLPKLLRMGVAGFKPDRSEEDIPENGPYRVHDGRSRWQDAWDRHRTYEGGQTIRVSAELHQLPIFVRAGSDLQFGNLNKEWKDAVAAANTPPDLRARSSPI